MGYKVSSLSAYMPLLVKGTAVTLAAWALAGALSLLLGTLLGILSCRHVGLSTLSIGIKIYTFITKGIPAYVQILIAYFVVPSLLGISGISGFVAASLALAVCSSGYVTEIVRAGLNNVPKGQWDACFVLGYPFYSTLRQVIMPQAFAAALPALIGELEQLLKSTSLLATIGVTELTRAGMNIISRELNPELVYLLIACIYLILSACINIVAFYMQRKVNYGYYR
jgi:His/Glu/Gln/Arg/opine family amino acid ABC transporter permease subunit